VNWVTPGDTVDEEAGTAGAVVDEGDDELQLASNSIAATARAVNERRRASEDPTEELRSRSLMPTAVYAGRFSPGKLAIDS
jgi:hypothetical protein